MIDTIFEIAVCVFIGALSLLASSLCIVGIIMLIKFAINTFKGKW